MKVLEPLRVPVWKVTCKPTPGHVCGLQQVPQQKAQACEGQSGREPGRGTSDHPRSLPGGGGRSHSLAEWLERRAGSPAQP